MDCRLFARQVQLDIDGLLSAIEREDMLQHAQVCPSCAALLQDMTELAGLLSTRLKAVEAPAGFAQDVMAALPQLPAKRAAGFKVFRPAWQRWGVVAAAAALLLAAGLNGLWPGQPGETPPIIHENPAPIVAADPGPGPLVQPPVVVGDIKPAPVSVPAPDDPTQASGNTEEVAVDPTEPVDDDPPPAAEIPNLPPGQVVAETGEGEIVDEPFEGGLDLPASAFSLAQPGGMFSLTVLAAYEDCDAILPSFNGDGLVNFYTKYKNKIYKWAQTVDAEAEPEYVDQVTALPALADLTGSMDESGTAGFSYISALSPDKRYTAVNCSGEQPGIWLYKNVMLPEATPEASGQALPEQAQPNAGLEISAAGGGKVLSWSPDGNKLLYTDNAGKLFAYYIYERNVQPLFGGTVTCASWAKDSKTVVFSGKIEKKAASAIYTIIVP